MSDQINELAAALAKAQAEMNPEVESASWCGKSWGLRNR